MTTEMPIAKKTQLQKQLLDYELPDLFRIRDSLDMLREYGLADEMLLARVKMTIERKV